MCIIVCMLYVVFEFVTDIAEIMCSLSFFVPFEIWFSGSLGENVFRGVWNKAQTLVYVLFSVRALVILM